MTTTKIIVNGFLFYVSMFVFAIFMSGGCETTFWYIPTAICGLLVYIMSQKYKEHEWRQFTGVNWIQSKTGIDLLADE